MEDLVIVKHNEPMCTSLDVASNFGKRHDKLLSEIERKYSDLIGYGCVQNGGHPFFIKSEYRHPQNGQTYPIYYINRDGFSLLVMGFTGKKALEWKWKYIEAFNLMERTLIEKSTTLWLQTREQTKIGRKEETNAIQKFVEYAKESGSLKGDMCYKHFSSLANKVAGISDRDLASVLQLSNLLVIERIIAIKILEGLQDKTEYHQIYKDIKTHLELFGQMAYLT